MNGQRNKQTNKGQNVFKQPIQASRPPDLKINRIVQRAFTHLEKRGSQKLKCMCIAAHAMVAIYISI